MKKELLLMLGSVMATVIISIAIIRWLAPQLLGIPFDLQLVQIDKKIPPFYEGVFRREDIQSREILLKDPLTRVRHHPLMLRHSVIGPHDILGFRNSEIPNVADVITIGDSQTYGNTVIMEENWPSVLKDYLDKDSSVYNMSTGGWAAIQYLSMFTNATLFRPRVIVVAFYTGNDPLESFNDAHEIESWNWLKSELPLSKSDMPKISLPESDTNWWQVKFEDGVETIFTPRRRLVSNQDHPTVKAGYDIMARVAEHMGKQVEQLDIRLSFTIIPTKELVYAEKVDQEGLVAPEDYLLLVEKEKENLENLAEKIKAIPSIEYIDVLEPLQQAALGDSSLYPTNQNGHPSKAGYKVIGREIATKIDPLLPESLKGLVGLKEGGSYKFYLITQEGVWQFDSHEILLRNGWDPKNMAVITKRDIAQIPHKGMIRTVDPERFGPDITETTPGLN